MTDRVDIIIIGVSLGGLDAVPRVIAPLPSDFRIPIVVIQHRAPERSALLAELLTSRCGREVVEPFHGTPIEAGGTYLAPPGYHLLVEPGSFSLSTEGPVTYARPSIDVTLESAAHSHGARAAAVVLTGSSSDGARGAAAVAARGGPVVIQEPSTAESPIAPEAAAKMVPSAPLIPLDAIGEFLATKHGGGR